MARMTLSEDEGLRLQGWRVFRSSSRDRVTPMSGPGGKLQRIKIGEALPSSDVYAGVAATAEERAISASARAQALAEARGGAETKPLGITQYLFADLVTITGNPSATDEADEFIQCAVAPFDGFLSEFDFTPSGSAGLRGLAIRSSGGATLFKTEDNRVLGAGQLGLQPDFLSFFHWSSLDGKVHLNNLKMPVFAGETLIAVSRQLPALPPLTQLGSFVLGFEGYILARPGSAAAVSQFGALIDDSRTASREASAQAARLALQKAKDSAALERAKIELEIAKVRAPGISGPTGLRVSGFEDVLRLGSALEQLQSRKPAVPPPPKVAAPPPAPPAGAGQTFVRSWMPQAGAIGYLIPTPPTGGKVTVFDNKYTVWSVSGQNLGQGFITPVGSDSDIPPGARISR